MRKNFGAKPYSYPQPVMIVASYDENNVPNAMNAAWVGISGSNKISLCLSPGHKSVKNIRARKDFTLSVGDEAHLVACDYVGIVSGNNVPDKFAKAGFHEEKSEFVDAPLIAELPMALECKMISYDEDSHILVSEIVNVNADESILNENGGVDPTKFSPIIFDPINNFYYKMGEKVGLAYQDGKELR
ncbi:MAG TPA: flavin reductase family protein [Candidatus Dorea intestinavium]|nr:flavin reductase family protein [Candidatus Dorea intestinavium]